MKSYSLLFTLFLVSKPIVSQIGFTVPLSDAPKNGKLQKQTLDSILYPNAKCLDGSPAVYYSSINPSFSKKKSKLLKKQKKIKKKDIWVIYLEAGGVCSNQEQCTIAKSDFRGSSLNYPSFVVGRTTYSKNCKINPDFCKANKVYIPYCSQDIFSGQRNKPINFINIPPFIIESDNGEFIFAGKFIFDAIINDLINNYGLINADMLLLTGISAGGNGVLVNIDDLIPKLPNTIVKGVSISSWTFSRNKDGDNSFPVFADLNGLLTETFTNDVVNLGAFVFLYNAFLPQNCKNLFEQILNMPELVFLCASIDVVYSTINAPMFFSEFSQDNVIISLFGNAGFPVFLDINDVPGFMINDTQKDYINYYQERLLKSMNQIDTNKDGVFIANCLQHFIGIEIGSPNELLINIDGETITKAAGDWFFERNLREFSFIDNCNGISCSNGCINNNIH